LKGYTYELHEYCLVIIILVTSLLAKQRRWAKDRIH